MATEKSRVIIVAPAGLCHVIIVTALARCKAPMATKNNATDVLGAGKRVAQLVNAQGILAVENAKALARKLAEIVRARPL